MKILHIIPSVDPKGGGPMEGVRQYGTRAEKSGHKIEVLSLDSPASSFLSDYPLKVHAIGPSFGSYSYNPNLKNWLRQNAGSYDAIIINGLWMYHGYGAWRALRKMKVPYFVFTHGMLDPWFKKTYPLKHLKKWLYWPWADYRLLRDARKVLFTCEQEKLLARKSFCLYNANEAVVNYGAGTPPTESEEELKKQFLDQFPDLSEKRLILFLSRIHEKKGADLLIKAFARVASSYPDLHLVVAGPCEDNLLSKLQRLASSLDISARITWPGMLKGSLKWGAFSASEVFVLVSHQENFGIAVAEALGAGRAVLISNQVNIWREIINDGAGLVCDDTEEGAHTILKEWLDLSQEERELMSAAAKRCFESRFTADAMAKSITSTIQEAIANDNKR